MPNAVNRTTSDEVKLLENELMKDEARFAKAHAR
jgi:hypothetical protein